MPLESREVRVDRCRVPLALSYLRAGHARSILAWCRRAAPRGAGTSLPRVDISPARAWIHSPPVILQFGAMRAVSHPS